MLLLIIVSGDSGLVSSRSLRLHRKPQVKKGEQHSLIDGATQRSKGHVVTRNSRFGDFLCLMLLVLDGELLAGGVLPGSIKA